MNCFFALAVNATPAGRLLLKACNQRTTLHGVGNFVSREIEKGRRYVEQARAFIFAA